jgi:hypothetical protein
MNTNLIRILIAVFLVAHAYIHVSLTYVPLPNPDGPHTPFWPSWWREAVDPAWPASKLGLPNGLERGLGSALWLLTAAGFTLMGLCLLFFPGLDQVWKAAAMLGAGSSLLLFVFYFHPWLVIGIAIDLAVLAGLWQQWPKFLFA